MSKKKKKVGSRQEKAVPVDSDGIRSLAAEVDDIVRAIKNSADSMDGADVEAIKPILQGLKSKIDYLKKRVKKEIVHRVDLAIEEKAIEDERRLNRGK